ncbi:alpha/beta fold hydrolase [Brevibacterium aurantiacum]|uniref:Alpha/beta hydrolase n=1 Tax=Brevibacterium aurantiacum TaxID=273384 RepID=A0A2A3ZMY3_BREAU|nr:alpha/beta fold hydrolase [Brevibacterium aurantiacum]PCC49342.1 alpha/beta hydrolase [Brevibacterium aurantiacum]PCC52811.1 alpha/beta hydrolase [Brevibacterium aurantiacum]
MTDIASKLIGSTGKRIVFLHGLFGRGKNFTSIAKALEPDYSSLLVDLPNHGDSEWTEDFSYVDMADSVAAMIAEMTAPDDLPVHLVGHSLGGKVAMVLALRHPELIDRLVVVDIAPTAGGSLGVFEHLLSSLAEVDLDDIESRTGANEALQAKIPEDTIRGFLLQNLRTTSAGYAWQPNLTLLHESLPTIGDFPDMGEASFDGPVLWMAGENSDYVSREDLPLMRSLFPRATLLTVKGSGHWVHSEQPKTFISALQTFFSRD